MTVTPRLRHPTDDAGQRTAPLPSVQAERAQPIGKVRKTERLQRGMPDAARPAMAFE